MKILSDRGIRLGFCVYAPSPDEESQVQQGSASAGGSETLVVVKRETGIGLETRRLVRDGERAFLIFERSDGTESRVEIDPSKVRTVANGRIVADFLYRGDVIGAPQQDV